MPTWEEMTEAERTEFLDRAAKRKLARDRDAMKAHPRQDDAAVNHPHHFLHKDRG